MVKLAPFVPEIEGKVTRGAGGKPLTIGLEIAQQEIRGRLCYRGMKIRIGAEELAERQKSRCFLAVRWDLSSARDTVISKAD